MCLPEKRDVRAVAVTRRMVGLPFPGAVALLPILPEGPMTEDTWVS